MSDGINITVESNNITSSQLVSHHIGQYLMSTGFTDVNISQADPLTFAEPSTQSEAAQAIRSLNPGLFDTFVNIDPAVFDWGGGGGTEMPDGPDSE